MKDALKIVGLQVGLPGGDSLLDGLSLTLEPGEAIAIVGPSGSGKSTLVRAIFETTAMRDEGFVVTVETLEVRGGLGLVPQKGAVFDHLDVAGNIELALRHSDQREASEAEVIRWLQAVDLDVAWASSSRSVAHLSGGEAQRLAVARALAGGQRILFLDEPSVGLDPLRVRGLAWQLRRICDDEAVALVVVTHDAHFAAEFADRVLLLKDGSLVPLPIDDRVGPGCRQNGDLDVARRQLESSLLEALAAGAGPTRRSGGSSPLSTWLRSQLGVFDVMVRAPASLPGYVGTHAREVRHVLSAALRQSLYRPLAFYGVVSFLLGFTVYYVLSTFGGEFGPGEAIRIVRGLPILALTAPLSAFLFVAASANAVNAWLGTMRLSRQTTALEALGISRVAYLWGPSWAGLVLAFLAVSFVFAFGFLVGGAVLCAVKGVTGVWPLLTGDLLDPAPDRAPYRVRAFLLVCIYAVGCASDAIAKADEPKPHADSVTRAMTRSVVACTLWVALLELVSLVILRLTQGQV